MNMKRKVVALLSGGLDSILAVRVILDQGVPVTAVRFMTHFGCDADGSGSCGQDVSPLAKLWGPLGLDIKYCHLGQEYIDMVKKPRFGRGKNMNPCIDCRVMMLTWARDVMEKEEACCLITGEVLNQRPMSQTRSEFARIEKVPELQGRVLRPLSAKLLEPTIAEEQGFIDREKLLDISGRGRTRRGGDGFVLSGGVGQGVVATIALGGCRETAIEASSFGSGRVASGLRSIVLVDTSV